MINGLGGTPISELYLLYGRAHEQLAARGIKVGRSYVGEYCTSLDMAGCSVTLVKLDDELECLLAAPAEIAEPDLLIARGDPRGRGVRPRPPTPCSKEHEEPNGTWLRGVHASSWWSRPD